MRIFIGIDHGAKGGLAALAEGGAIFKLTRMPLTKPDGKIDSHKVFKWIEENFGDYHGDVVLCAEDLHAIHGSSAKSNFNFGKNIGKVVGVVECLPQMKYYEVTPKKWQEHQFTHYSIPEMTIHKKGNKKPSRDTKGMAKVCASKVWELDIFDHILNDGVIDALLIANYARQTYKEQK